MKKTKVMTVESEQMIEKFEELTRENVDGGRKNNFFRENALLVTDKLQSALWMAKMAATFAVCYFWWNDFIESSEKDVGVIKLPGVLFRTAAVVFGIVAIHKITDTLELYLTKKITEEALMKMPK